MSAYLRAVGDRQTTDSDQHLSDWLGGGAWTPTDCRGDEKIRDMEEGACYSPPLCFYR